MERFIFLRLEGNEIRLDASELRKYKDRVVSFTERFHLFLLTALVCLIAFGQANAQFSQQGSKLVGTGAVGTAAQGSSVSLSSDGNTAIVGGMWDNSNAGAAWIWRRSAGVWAQQGSKLVGTGAVGNAEQGWSVSLSADGNTAIVGGISDNSTAGAAWIWTRSAGVWTQQGSKLVGTGAVGYANQGTSVSLSSDGNTAIIGGWSDNSDAGAAWIWTRSAGVWTQQGSKLVGTGAVGYANQGSSVSLSPDGNTAIVGGIWDNASAGAVWIWTCSAGVWTQQGSKLVGTDAVGNAEQGFSVSLSSDGNTAIVGGYFDNSNAGAAWIWTRSGGVWTQQGSKLVGTGAVSATRQGNSVSLSSDGNTAIVGGYLDNSVAGAAWIWTRSGGVWTQQGSKLVGTGAVGNAAQGYSARLSSDGNTAIIGGYVDNSSAGAAWIFATPNAPMPVELVSFNATMNVFNAELRWTTATEVNNSAFDIERRPASMMQWTKVGSVAGAGTSNVRHNYSFFDNTRSPGTYSYRLKQIDRDGAFKYSQEVQVTIEAPRVFALSQNYPDPFNPTTTISYSLATRSRVTLSVFNILGQKVRELVNGEKEAGSYNLAFDASGLASGVYFYCIQAGSFVQAKKLVVVK
jgi:antibiotic biosynthesis monooxygenase (ABM) superfamily enzyme